MIKRTTTACVVMGVLVNMALIGSVFADTKVVDPSGGGDYMTIQAAVNDLTNSGPRTIIVRAGTYHEAVRLSARNTQATNDSQRIIIMADTNAAPGSVIVTPPSGSSGVYVGQSRFITVQGLTITGVGGKGVPAVNLDGGSQDNEDIAIVGCQIHHNSSHGIQVQSGNPRTWIMNNLIRDNGSVKKKDHGVTIADGVGATMYLVNNTIVRNKFDGVFVDVPRPLYLVNNLIASNGGYGVQRAKGSSDLTAVTLLYNMFYANTAGDITLASQILDATDSGNRTTAGNEGIGVVRCTFSGCGHTTPLTALFVNPGAMGTDFHLAADSPAIDRGVNTFSDGATTWVIVEDLEGHPRPQDGDADCFAIADAGCYEAPAVSCQADAVPPLARLLLGDGSGLISNVNANTLGGIPAAGYATTIGSYPNMSVGTATFATTAGNALSLGNIPPGGYVRTNDARVVHAITNLYSTGSGSVTVSGNAGIINFGSGGSGGGGVTNRWLLNGGPVLTNDELEIVAAGGLTGALSNYGSRVQLTLSNTTSVGTVTYAESSGYATNAGSAGTATFALNSGYATNAGNATFATTAGTAGSATSADSAAFATSSGYATNAGAAASAGIATFATSSGYATNAGTAASATTAGTATFAVSSGYATNAGGAGTATFAVSSGYATNAGTATFATSAGVAPAQSLSNVLAVGNISGTGIVMSAKDAITSHGFYFVDGSGNTNQFLSSGSNVVHIAPSGTTGEVWDAINLPTNGTYLDMTVGTATFATFAVSGNYATNAGTAQIASNLTSGAAQNLTNGFVTGSITNSLATTQAVETARINAIATNKVANATFADSASYATSAGTATFATGAGTATFSSSGINAVATNKVAYAGTAILATNALQLGGVAATSYVTNGASPTFANITDSGLSASQAVMTDGSKKLVSTDYLNQSVKTDANPSFNSLTTGYIVTDTLAENTMGNNESIQVTGRQLVNTLDVYLDWGDDNVNVWSIGDYLPTLMVHRSAGQTQDLQQWVTEGGVVLAAINSNGAMRATSFIGAVTFATSSGYATNAGAATSAGMATFASNANTATNALQLGSVVAAGYSTTQAVETARINAIATNKVAAATFADSANTASNALQLGGTVAASYVTNGSTASFANITNTGLTANKPVFTDGSSKLVSTGTVPVALGGTGNTSFYPTGLVYYSGSALTNDASITWGPLSGYLTISNLHCASIVNSYISTYTVSSPGDLTISAGANFYLGGNGHNTYVVNDLGGEEFHIQVPAFFESSVSGVTFSASSGYATNAGSSGTATFSVSSGYATNAGTATFAAFANNANTATNALQLGSIVAAGYSTTQAVESARTHAIATNKVAAATFADSASYATNAGTATFATGAGTATFATFANNANTATNALKLGGTIASSYVTNGSSPIFYSVSDEGGYSTNRFGSWLIYGDTIWDDAGDITAGTITASYGTIKYLEDAYANDVMDLFNYELMYYGRPVLNWAGDDYGQVYIYTGDTTIPSLVVKEIAGQTANLQNWVDQNGNVLASVDTNGAFHPPHMTDASAANDSIYYSTTQNKLVYKDSGGVVHNLY